MNPTYIASVWPLFLAGGISLFLAGIGIRRSGAPGARSFTLLMLGLALWSVPDGLLLISDDPFWQHLWTKVEYVGIALVPLFWATTAMEYTGQWRLLGGWRWWAGAAAIPAVTIFLAWTFESHPLIYREYSFYRSQGLLLLDIEYGPWWWINAAYSYVLLLWGAGLLLLAAARTFYLYRTQALALLVGISFPVLGNLVYIFRVGPFGHVDPTPFSFALAGIPLAWAIFRLRLFDLTPVAREAVMEGMQDGVVVLDRMNRVADLNPAAERVLGVPGKKLIGRSAAEALGVWLGMPGDAVSEGAARRDVALRVQGEERVFEMTSSPLGSRWGGPLGRILMLSDVTHVRVMGEKLDSAQEEIRILSELLPMCAWCKQVRADDGYWEELETYLTRRSKTQFTHGICPSCRARITKASGMPGKASAPGEEEGGPGTRRDPEEGGPRAGTRRDPGGGEPWPGPRDPG